MSKQARKAAAPFMVLLALFATFGFGIDEARAEVAMLHYAGYGLEEGGFQQSEPGQELNIMARITNINAINPSIPYDPEGNEYTVVLSGLVSGGEDVQAGITTIHYGGGRLEIYEDSAFNSGWEEIPIIGSPPAAFLDGELWLSGNFQGFTLEVVRETGQGYYQGNFQVDGGLAMPYVQGDAYTFAGILAEPTQPYLPDGYEFAVDGEIWVHETTATRDSSWSAVKSLF